MADPVVAKLAQVFSDQARALAYRYTSGQIDGGAFQIEMRAMLRKWYGMQMVAASGKNPADINPNDWLRLGSQLQEQYRYLEQFAREAAAGNLTPAQIEARTALYAESSKQMYWTQKMPVTLPAQPADGSTRCGSNDACNWSEPVEVRDSSGDVIALEFTWELEPGAAHCPDCLARAARWNPLRLPVG